MSDLGKVHVLCPNFRCKQVITAPPELRGKLFKCPFCSTVVRTPIKKGATATEYNPPATGPQ